MLIAVCIIWSHASLSASDSAQNTCRLTLLEDTEASSVESSSNGPEISCIACVDSCSSSGAGEGDLDTFKEFWEV